MSELRELAKKKPRGKADENLIGELTRLESALTLAKDDLVGFRCTKDAISYDLSAERG